MKSYLNYISNIIGFPNEETSLQCFSDLVKDIKPKNSDDDNFDSFHLVISFWSTGNLGVGFSKNINIYKKLKRQEINITVLIPSKKKFKWGIDCKEKEKINLNKRYFNFLSLDEESKSITSMDGYLEEVCNHIRCYLIEKDLL